MDLVSQVADEILKATLELSEAHARGATSAQGIAVAKAFAKKILALTPEFQPQRSGIGFTDEQREVMGKAIRVWGEHQQVIKAIEEMSELTQALSKWLNLRTYVFKGSLTEANVRNSIDEELADVTIMMEQLRQIFGDQYQPSYIGTKLTRLRSYLPPDGSDLYGKGGAKNAPNG